MNHYERIIYLLEGAVKKANKAKKGEFESREGRKVDATRPDKDIEKNIQRGVRGYRHSSASTHRERSEEGVKAIQRGRFRDARREDSSK